MLILFTQGSHHKNITVIFINHNIFDQGKNARTIALNVKYIVLFSNPRDNLQISYLGRQLFPKNGQSLQEAHTDAINSQKWGYLLIDLQPQTPNYLRLRSHIFPNECPMITYFPKE